MSGLTTRLGVLGWPIEHSLSPPMQRAGLAALGLPWDYAPFAVDPAAPEALARAIEGARALGLIGLNITMPHKAEALRLCQPDERARRAGAVNTLHFHPADAPGSPPRGSNTDGHGFTMLCAELGRPLAPGQRVVILGGGGAARGVLLALREAGIALDTVTLARRAQAADLLPALRTCDVLVDATPRGLHDGPLSTTHPELAGLTPLPPGCLVLDLVVRRETALTTAARAAGLPASAGAPMLLHQGAAALALWLERPLLDLPAAVVAAMRAALDRVLSSRP